VSSLAPRDPLFNTTLLCDGTPVQKIAAADVTGCEQIARWRQDVEAYDGSAARLGRWLKAQGGGGA
jgi:hypothetical protein